MSCFWTDFVNCFEDCSDGCELFADVLPTYEAVFTFGMSIFGFEDADIDTGTGTFNIQFPSDSGITACTITGGLAKIPTDIGECDAGCCMGCRSAPGCTAFTNFDPGIDYHFDTDGGATHVTIVELPVTELVQDLSIPTKFSGPLDALCPGSEDTLGAFVTAFNVATNLGPLCDLRFASGACY